jgi:hypothetical protein
MYRASLKIEVEIDGQVLAERAFCQEDQNLDELKDMFLTTVFHRGEGVCESTFETAEVEDEKRIEAEEKKKSKKKKKATKKKKAAKQNAKEPDDNDGEDASSSEDT